ncbi:MAG: hypothetical protein AAF570_12330, partial [Bacteroidota bacterium]
MGTASGNFFLTNPANTQGHLIWKKDTRSNVTYQLRLTERNRIGQLIRVKNTPVQSEHYFHFDEKMRRSDTRWSARVRTLVNGLPVGTSDEIDIGPMPELDDQVNSTLQCTWYCPGMGYQIDAYCMSSGNNGCHAYVMELYAASVPYYQYMPYSVWQQYNPFGLIDNHHVIDLGNVDYSDGYCSDGNALTGHIVGVIVENPYGFLHTGQFTGNSPCVLGGNVNQAGLLLEQNCANCDPGTSIDCNVSGDCVGGGWTTVGGNYDYGDTVYISPDSQWVVLQGDLVDGGFGGDVDNESDLVLDEIIHYDDFAEEISVFNHVAFSKYDLHDVADVALSRLDVKNVPVTNYSVSKLDKQDSNHMRFRIDMKNKPAGVYNLFIRFDDGRFLRRIFVREAASPSKKVAEFVDATPEMDLYPNPASEQLTVSISMVEGPA